MSSQSGAVNGSTSRVLAQKRGGRTMNKYQKILTIVGLVTFLVIIWLHYLSQHDLFTLTAIRLDYPYSNRVPVILDVHMPLFVLGVLYAGAMGLAMRRRAQ
jgi:hypothetical protein